MLQLEFEKHTRLYTQHFAAERQCSVSLVLVRCLQPILCISGSLKTAEPDIMSAGAFTGSQMVLQHC